MGMESWAGQFSNGIPDSERTWASDILQTSDPIHGLLSVATTALYREDQLLHDAFSRRRERAGFAPALDGVDKWARGLSFWVFEHNLVFPIFRAWLPLVNDIRWDENADGIAGGARGSRFPDLRIECGTNGTAWYAFELKWWNLGRGERVLGGDADKLRKLVDDHRTSMPQEGHLLGAFVLATWWGTSESIGDDFRVASDPGAGLRPVFAGIFPSNVLFEKCHVAGYMALVAYRVEPQP